MSHPSEWEVPASILAEDEPLQRRLGRIMGVILLVFMLKGVLLALIITPLWDVPDETGHFAYIEEMADTGRLPIPGRSRISQRILEHWGGGEAGEPVFNWVSQHPPLYHLLALPVFRLARAGTDSLEWQVRLTRLTSVVLGTVALFVLFQAILVTTGSAGLALALAGGMAFVPMFSHLAAGINHDVTMLLLGSGAAFFWGRLARTGRFGDGISMAACAGLAGGVKLSVLAILVPLLGTSFRFLSSRGARRIGQFTVIAATAALIPTAWSIRSAWLMKTIVVVPGGHWRHWGIEQYLRDFPVFDHTVKNFLGLMGWTGAGGELRWFQISGWAYLPYAALGICLALGTLVWLEREVAWKPGRFRPYRIGVGIMVLIALGALALGLWPGGGILRFARHLWYVTIVAVPLFALAIPVVPSKSRRSIILSALLVFGFFLLAYLLKIWDAYRFYGEMRATHGRYFLLVVPFMAIGFGDPARLLLGRLKPVFWRWAPVVPLVLFLTETAFYVREVIPFYRGDGGP